VLRRGRNFCRRTQRGLTKICAAGKIGGRVFFKFAEKGPKFLKDYYSYKKLKISAEKYTSSPDIFDFSFPLPRKRQRLW
jgi:hypothetical protein